MSANAAFDAQAIIAAVDRRRDQLIDLCRRLVSINTVNPYAGDETAHSEKEGQEFFAQYLRRLGPTQDTFECPADIFERSGLVGPAGRSFRDRPIVVNQWTFGRGRSSLIVNGHMDTVAAGGMAFDPFGAEVRDGCILGRGTCDDKGGLAAAAIGIEAALEMADRFDGRLVFESVIDEECSGSGAGTLACVDRGYVADAALVVDGPVTPLLRGCGGVLTAEVHVTGQPGHAAACTGVNAIDKAVWLKDALDQFRTERHALGSGRAVNIGVFHGGVHPAVVPAHAHWALNMCYTQAEACASQDAGLGWSGRCVAEAFEKAVLDRARLDPYLRDHLPRIVWVKDLYPYEVPATDPFVEICLAMACLAAGRDVEHKVLDAWFDAAHLNRRGHMPTVGAGVGDEGQAHSDHEQVPIAHLLQTARLVALLVAHQLGA